MAKLSENASRLALQRAHTLIADDRSEIGLHWLSRALDLAPEGGSPLTREIRTTMAVVANTLPQPRFVVASDEDRVFSSIEFSPDRSRVAQLIATVPPASPEAIEAQILDTTTGRLMTAIDVPPTTTSIGFTADGETVYSYDGEQLHLWSAKTGTSRGPAAEIRDAIPSQILPEFLQRLAESSLSPQQEGLLQAIRQRQRPIADVGPGGDVIVYQKRVPREPVGAGGRPFGAPGRGSRSSTAMALLDLTSGKETLVTGDEQGAVIRAQFVRGGQWLLYQSRSREARGTLFEAWDVANDTPVADWEIECEGAVSTLGLTTRSTTLRLSHGSHSSRSDGDAKIQVYRVSTPESPIATHTVTGQVDDLALSPSGRWAAIVTSVQGEQPHVTVWDIEHDRSRTVPLWLERAESSSRNINTVLRSGSRQMVIAADGKTLVFSDGERLVGWQLPPETRWQAELPTAGPIQQFQVVGHELRTVSGVSSRSLFSLQRGPGLPLELGRWDLTRRRSLGNVIPVLAQAAVICPDGRQLLTVQGNTIQRWNWETLSTIGEPLRIDAGQISHLEYVAQGQRIAVHTQARRTTAPAGRGGSARSGGDESSSRIHYNRIGIRIKDGLSGRGVLVGEVFPESPAAAAGLRVNDLLLRIGDREARSTEEFIQLVDLQSDHEMEVVLQRDGVEQTGAFDPGAAAAERRTVTDRRSGSRHGSDIGRQDRCPNRRAARTSGSRRVTTCSRRRTSWYRGRSIRWWCWIPRGTRRGISRQRWICWTDQSESLGGGGTRWRNRGRCQPISAAD